MLHGRIGFQRPGKIKRCREILAAVRFHIDATPALAMASYTTRYADVSFEADIVGSRHEGHDRHDVSSFHGRARMPNALARITRAAVRYFSSLRRFIKIRTARPSPRLHSPYMKPRLGRATLDDMKQSAHRHTARALLVPHELIRKSADANARLPSQTASIISARDQALTADKHAY